MRTNAWQFKAVFFLACLASTAWGISCPQLLIDNQSPHIKNVPESVKSGAGYATFLRRERRFFWSAVFSPGAAVRTVPVFFRETEKGLSVFLAMPKEDADAPLLSSLVGPVFTTGPQYTLGHHKSDALPDEVRNALNAGKNSVVVEIRGAVADRGQAILRWLIETGHLFETTQVAHSGTTWIGTMAQAMEQGSTEQEDFQIPGNWEWLTAPGRILFWNQEKLQNETVPIVLRIDQGKYRIYIPAKDENDAANTYSFIVSSEQKTLRARGEAYFSFGPTSKSTFLEASKIPEDVRKLLPLGPMVEIACDTPALILDGIIGSLDGRLTGTISP